MRSLRTAASSLPLVLFFLSSTATAAPAPALEERGAGIVRALTNGRASTLVAGVHRLGDGETVVRYAQTHHALPVIGRGAAVRFSSSGRTIGTRVALEEDLPEHVEPALPPRAAAEIAAARSMFTASASDAHLVIWPTLDRGARLAWAVLPRVPVGLPTMPRVIVDAQTGEVLELRDMVRFAKATVYASNPTRSPELTTFDLPILPDGSTLANPFLQSANCIDKKTVKPVNMFGFNLNVHVCDLVQTAAPNASGDYVYDPADVAGSAEARQDEFSEVSMYFHASKAYEFFRELQGVADAQVVVDKPLRVISNLQIPQGIATGDLAKAGDPNLPLQPFQNAFFAPAGGGLGELFQQLYGFTAGALWFGQGPIRDYAYDGDVVYHELTHAVVDATLGLGAWRVDARGAIDAPGAMNEALADYFSSAITGDPDVGEYAGSDLGAGEDAPIRSLENQDRCAGLVGQVHTDSTVFSGALWSARMSLPEGDRRKLDAALYKTMLANPGSATIGFEDLAKLLITQLKTDLPAGATAVESKMTERGLLPGCERITRYSGEPLRSRSSRIGFVAPGKQVVNVKGIAPGILQLEASIPEGTASVTVSFSMRAASAAAQSPFGGSAKPFTPVVLAKIGAPIAWDPKSKTGHDASFKVDATSANGKASALIELPEGTPAGSVFLQIASTGDSEGSYDTVALELTPRTMAEAPAPATPDDGAVTADADSGCSAAKSPSSAGGAGMLALGAALTALGRRWRRSRR